MRPRISLPSSPRGSDPTERATPRPRGLGRRHVPVRAAILLGLALLPWQAGCGGQTNDAPVSDCGGRRLMVFASDRGATAGQYSIYLYDFDGLGFRLVTNLNSPTVPNIDPAITSNLEVVAFVSERATGAGGTDILLYDRCRAQLVAAPGINSAGHESEPAFSYDSYKLAFVRDTLGDKRIRLIDGIPDVLIPLPNLDAPAGFDDYSPSPDLTGALIAFVSNRNGNPDVFVYDAGGDSLRALPDLISPGDDVDPWITPNGQYLAFASNRTGGAGDFDLYLYDIETKVFITLAAALNTGAVERSPNLSADASLMVFQSNRASSLGRMDLWNHTRSSGAIGQAASESSADDDVQPYMVWP